jgi:hypothetical protein
MIEHLQLLPWILYGYMSRRQQTVICPLSTSIARKTFIQYMIPQWTFSVRAGHSQLGLIHFNGTNLAMVTHDSHLISNWIKSQNFIALFFVCLIHVDQLDMVVMVEIFSRC